MILYIITGLFLGCVGIRIFFLDNSLSGFALLIAGLLYFVVAYVRYKRTGKIDFYDKLNEYTKK